MNILLNSLFSLENITGHNKSKVHCSHPYLLVQFSQKCFICSKMYFLVERCSLTRKTWQKQKCRCKTMFLNWRWGSLKLYCTYWKEGLCFLLACCLFFICLICINHLHKQCPMFGNRGSYTRGHFIWNLWNEPSASFINFILNDHECKILFIIWPF